jgi:hypothetical protein
VVSILEIIKWISEIVIRKKGRFVKSAWMSVGIMTWLWARWPRK